VEIYRPELVFWVARLDEFSPFEHVLKLPPLYVSGGMRSHDLQLQSPRLQMKTTTLDHAARAGHLKII
jgi:hypothetical protein